MICSKSKALDAGVCLIEGMKGNIYVRFLIGLRHPDIHREKHCLNLYNILSLVIINKNNKKMISLKGCYCKCLNNNAVHE